jgi:phosphopantothenoylcysteine decarboxylase/phosphopantothenate--cysteine ligase
MKTKHIVLGVTASIAIYKACEIVRRLLSPRLGLSVVMTKNAARLISPQVFSSLSGNRVYWDEFQNPGDWEIEHISLAKRADLVLIVPATANIIGKVANGIADDLLTTTIMATRAPVFIAPAMNKNMYQNRIVQANIKKLKNIGFKFIEPKVGNLACGDVGLGHLAEIDEIIRVVKRHLE